MTPLYIAADTDMLKVGGTISKDDVPQTLCLAFQSVDDALLAAVIEICRALLLFRG